MEINDIQVQVQLPAKHRSRDFVYVEICTGKFVVKIFRLEFYRYKFVFTIH